MKTLVESTAFRKDWKRARNLGQPASAERSPQVRLSGKLPSPPTKYPSRRGRLPFRVWYEEASTFEPSPRFP